ncbi:MAG: hypothetical protein IPN75_18560 [Dechloromonas sp.]|uniref:Uncharacterized protein n=1 Tax=Candidatus Dechloromonas phosphorivorans TaxID=2899244 RepID=A0A9D7LVZ1_9RHOO|nr:hypothetical protein [Candidatus Dechloromonas phosphorivorans]
MPIGSESYADKLEAERKKDEAAQRKQLKEQQAAANAGPSAASVESCLRTLDRMALDSSRRADLEDGCRATGSVQPVYVPVPSYYGGSGYIRPIRRIRLVRCPGLCPSRARQPSRSTPLQGPGNQRGR